MSTIIALYHPDPEAADRNAMELKRRWSSAYLDVRPEDRPIIYARSSDGAIYEYPDDTPFTDLCAPLKTQTMVFDESSVLIATCLAKHREATLIGTTGPDLYWGLYNNHELLFLVPDTGEVKRK